MKAEDIISWGNLSEILTGRNDVIRKNRIQKQYSGEISELVTLINYWMHKNTPKTDENGGKNK